jgi:alpha-L-fucosidase
VALRIIYIAACIAVLAASACAQTQTATQSEARIAWWRAARFGMFIHWGIYSIPGRGEWVQWNEQIPVEEYAKLAEQFHPSAFEPDAWAMTAKAAGMKYVVMTARHHDGFAMFDSKASDFTSVKTAAHRDFVADYVKAVRNAGLRVGLYYSPLDWRYPGFFFPDLQLESAEAMRRQYHLQVEELLSNYGPIDVLWFDGGEMDWLNFGGHWAGAQWRNWAPGEHYHGRFNWEHDQVYAMIRRLQPQILVNNRADMPEDFHSREGDSALGDFDDQHPWELCTTLVVGAWGWQPNREIKSLKDVVQLLVKVAGRDGNLLLNVGPRPDGQIDPPQAQRLREVGDWLSKYGESIYGTRGGPFLLGTYGVSTHKEKTIYLHLLGHADSKIVLPPMPPRILKASLLGGAPAAFTQTDRGIEISVPMDGRSDIDTIVRLELSESTAGMRPRELTSVNVSGM